MLQKYKKTVDYERYQEKTVPIFVIIKEKTYLCPQITNDD